MNNSETDQYTIITGKFETGGPEIKKVISDILGADKLEEKYKLYFYWFNVIHELGHVILRFNEHENLSDFEEEPIVNDFAIAFWSYYGETLKFKQLSELIQDSIPRFVSPVPEVHPVPEDINYIEYAEKNWGKETFFTWNNYGWFQFNCVLNSLCNKKSLEDMLRIMSNNMIITQPKLLLSYEINADKLPMRIVQDATVILRDWGINLPDIPHIMVDDPFRHGISKIGY